MDSSSQQYQLDQEAYELTGNQFATYGFQYVPGFDGGVSFEVCFWLYKYSSVCCIVHQLDYQRQSCLDVEGSWYGCGHPR